MRNQEVVSVAVYEILSGLMSVWVLLNVFDVDVLVVTIAVYNVLSILFLGFFVRSAVSRSTFDKFIYSLIFTYSVLILFFMIYDQRYIRDVLFFRAAIDPGLLLLTYTLITVFALFRVEFNLYKMAGVVLPGIRGFLFSESVTIFNSKLILPDISSVLSFSDIGKRRQLVVIHLVQRARSLQLRANYVLLSIGVLIVSGVILIFFAGEIVSTDAQTDSKLKQIRALIADYESSANNSVQTLSSAEGELSNILSILTKSGIIVQSSTTPVSFVYPSGVNFSDDQLRFYGELTNKYASIRVVEEDIRSRLLAQRQMIVSVESDIPKNISTLVEQEKPHTADSNLLIASAITRFGILLIIVFLVQILVGIYRYSLKLATFYNSRADALLLTSGKSGSLGVWDQLMLPRDIDFGRTPVPPSQYIAEIAQSVFSRIKAEEKSEKLGS